MKNLTDEKKEEKKKKKRDKNREVTKVSKLYSKFGWNPRQPISDT